MGLETLLDCPRALKRHRQEPLGDVVDGFCDWLICQNYAKPSLINHIKCIAGFNAYLRTKGLKSYTELTRNHCEAFLQECYSRRRKKLKIKKVAHPELYTINRFLPYLLAVKKYAEIAVLMPTEIRAYMPQGSFGY